MAEFNRERPADAQMPYLAALVCCSAFDIALHDAYGQLHAVPTYDTYNSHYLNHDLADFYSADDPDAGGFRGKYPADFLAPHSPRALPVWHLVGGLDPLDKHETTGREPNDGYPIVLTDWIERRRTTLPQVKLHRK